MIRSVARHTSSVGAFHILSKWKAEQKCAALAVMHCHWSGIQLAPARNTFPIWKETASTTVPTFLEAQLCANEEEVIIVGGGNAAGQAAVFLSQTVKHVHMLSLRSGGLAKSLRMLSSAIWFAGLKKSKGNPRCTRIPR